jgi:hypothetical protein
MAKFYPADEPVKRPPAKAKEQKKQKFYPAEEEVSEPSYSDKLLGAAQGVLEKGGGSKRALEDYMSESSGHTQTAIDGAYGAVQGATFNMADEGYGAVRALVDERPYSEAYPDHRDEARRAWAEARARSPIASTVGEVGGAVLSPGSKILGAGKGLRGVLRGAAEGGAQSYGATDKEGTMQFAKSLGEENWDWKALSDPAIETGMGAGLGAGVGLISNAVTSGFSKSPSAVRAEVLGTKGKDWRVDGPGDRQGMVGRVSETGMLKNRKSSYDVDSNKFKPEGKSKFQIDEIEKNTEERLLGRAEDAIEKIQMRKEEKFGMLLDNRYVPSAKIDQMSSEIADEYRKRGLFKGPFNRDEAVEKIRQHIYDQVMAGGGDMSRFSLREIDQLKRMAQEDVRNFSKGLGELGDNDELARITARKLKNLVEDNIGGGSIAAEFKKLNGRQHDFLTAKGDLQGKLKSLELAKPAGEQVNKTSLTEKFISNFSGGSQGRLDRAAAKEWYDGAIPKPVRAVVPYAAEEAPGVMYRQNMQGQEGAKGNWRNPSGAMDQGGNIPEELIRTPLPRTTQELIEKKPFVLAKIAQMMPDMFDAVKDVFDHNPEGLPELAQVISMKMPHVFAKDKYNRFDGRILNEADKQKAIKDTLLKDELSSIAQAKIITRLNKEGLYDD